MSELHSEKRALKPRAKKPRIALGADHAGVHAKEQIKRYLQTAGYTVDDLGTESDESVDYPDFAVRVANHVAQKQSDFGILTCGTGIGMSITANKVGGIRAALAYDPVTARMAREHNDANVLTVGARVLTVEQILAVVESFLGAQFAGGRHQRRVDKIMELDHESKPKG